jgi:hypothetical protein
MHNSKRYTPLGVPWRKPKNLNDVSCITASFGGLEHQLKLPKIELAFVDGQHGNLRGLFGPCAPSLKPLRSGSDPLCSSG